MSGHSQRVVFPSEFTEFRLVLGEPTSFEHRDFVVTFRFFNHTGDLLGDSDLNASYSNKLGAYFRYLLSSDEGVGQNVIKPIKLIRPARSVEVGVLPWKSRDAAKARAVQSQLFAVAADADTNFIWTGRIGAK